MGRRRLGPVRQTGSDIWYVRLTVPPDLRQKAGKTRLIRSLGTTSHSIALSRYAAAYTDLEKELQTLLNGPAVRQLVEFSAEDEVRPGDQPLSALEQTRIALNGKYDPNDPFHSHVFEYFNKGIELPISWSEAIDLWIEVRNRENTRPLSKGTIKKVNFNVEDFKPYADPLDITFDILDSFVSDQEKVVTPATVKSKLKGLSGILSALVSKRKLEHNILKDYSYKVGQQSKKRAYTDDEFRLIASKEPACFWLAMTGMRPLELQNVVIENDILVVTEQDDNEFRPKTLSSYRRVPLPQGFTQPSTSPKTWRKNCRALIEDRNVTPHSGRYFFIQTSRRAGCDAQVVAEICGHGSDKGSTTQRGYGDFPDEVLIRESQKVWEYIYTHIIKNADTISGLNSLY